MLIFFSGIGITSLLNGNVCTTEEHPGTDKEILSSLVPNTGDGENDNDVSDKNDALPSRPTSKELQYTIRFFYRAVQSCSEHGLEICNLALKCENVFTKARTQGLKIKEFRETLWRCRLVIY